MCSLSLAYWSVIDKDLLLRQLSLHHPRSHLVMQRSATILLFIDKALLPEPPAMKQTSHVARQTPVNHATLTGSPYGGL